MNWKKLNRKIHYWGAIACAIPLLIVIVTGVFLLLKKDVDWIQPSSTKGQGNVPTLDYVKILPILKNVSEVEISDWSQINKIDVRPSKGMMKIQIEGNWEVQLDHQTGDILKVAYRRSDIIETIHMGTFFHDYAKLGIFLPTAILLLVLWLTGLYLFFITERAKYRSRSKQKSNNIVDGIANTKIT